MSKRNKIHDPHFSREAEKYENPIPSREFIMEYLKDAGHPVTRDELVSALGLETEEQQEALRRRLRAMERDGQLMGNRRGGYGLIDKMNLIRGRVLGHRDGFGFVVPDEGGSDLFLSAREMRAVFDGDRVLVRVSGIDRRNRREAAVVEVLERNTTHVVGRFFVEAGVAFVVPDNKRISQEISIPPSEQGSAEPGQIVSAEIIGQPSLRARAIGRIVEVLGDHMAPGMEIGVAIRSHGLPHTWPVALLSEIDALTETVSDAAKQGREDIRHLPLVTIDGEDAQDFDDAVYCVAKSKQAGWTLYVAIADVSAYVSPDTALDQEALVRGNSVYFPGQVIPMLPEILSNGLCSLKPNVDRLCMVSEMNIDAHGKITRYRFYPAVMHSKARLTYTEVAAQLEGKSDALKQRYPALIPGLHELHRLYQALRKARDVRGAIDFETVETRVVFGPERKIEKILPTQRNEAHKIIEECMLAANVAAASYLEKQKIPTLYRVHNGPNPEKIADVRDFLKELNLGLRGGEHPQPEDYAKLLSEIASRPDARLIQTVLLRSLSQAVYAPKNTGHFGLAYESYAQFTSPIRRYPDLIVHRSIRHALGKKAADKFKYDLNTMAELGEHCSMTERRADEATRDALDWLKCEFMLDRVGEEFAGIITSVTGFGLFIELQDIYVEGLLHITALKNDYYRFDPIKHRLYGERTGMVYRLGDRIRVKVVRVNLEDKKIDFELAGAAASNKPPKKLPKKKKASKKSKAKKKKS